MKLEKLACNSCGAPLEVPESANFVTCNHCSTQLAVNRSESVTFTEAIDRLAEQTEELGDRVDRLSIEGELATLNREWQEQKELLGSGFGTREAGRPTKAFAVVLGVAGVVFGGNCLRLAWSAQKAYGRSGLGEFAALLTFICALGGVFMLAFGLISSVVHWKKATDYNGAERTYLQPRDELLSRLGSGQN